MGLSKEHTRRGLRLSFMGVVANVLLIVVKLASGILGHSFALIADAMESALDVLSSVILWSGLKIGSIPPDVNHPYGHGKAEPVAAMVIAFSLVGAALALAIESILGIMASNRPTPALFTLPVLSVVIVTKEILYRLVAKGGDEIGSTALNASARHHRADALTSLAAFIGISVAIAGGKGYESADAWAALVACLIIAFNGYHILRPALAEVMDTAPTNDIEDKVRALARNVEGVLGLDQCRVRKYGLEFVVDLHVIVDGELTVRRGHEIAHRVKDKLLQSQLQIADVLVHIEPAKEK